MGGRSGYRGPRGKNGLVTQIWARGESGKMRSSLHCDGDARSEFDGLGENFRVVGLVVFGNW